MQPILVVAMQVSVLVISVSNEAITPKIEFGLFSSTSVPELPLSGFSICLQIGLVSEVSPLSAATYITVKGKEL